MSIIIALGRPLTRLTFPDYPHPFILIPSSSLWFPSTQSNL